MREMGNGMLGSLAYVLVALLAIEVLTAAVIDARRRVFPAWLMALMLVTGVGCACALGGFERALFGCAASFCLCLALTGFEVAWRRIHGGAMGLGMGDIKFLAALMPAWPAGAAVSFAGGLALLAMAGVVCKKPSLPLIPFVVCAAPIAALAL